MPGSPDQGLVARHLRNLRSSNQLRRFLADLNYPPADEPVSISDWKPDLAATARDGNLRVLARHDDFVVTCCRLAALSPTPEREMVTRLVRQYDRGLFVFADQTESRWHFINVKRDSRRHNRLVLRRIAVGPEEQLRTAIERMAPLKVADASWSGLEVELRHEEAFDVEKVTKQFYRDYKDIFDHIWRRLERQVATRTARAFAQQFMNRLMFLYFLQKKGWLASRRDFVPWLWQRYQDEPAAQGDFYTRYLDALFFQALNSPSDDLTPSTPKLQLLAQRDLPDDLKQVFSHLPYLNGGLFSRLPDIDDQGLTIEDSEFENLFENLLEKYNFTVSEDTPLDVEVAVNPELLGNVYENLVLEEERGQAGIFYTPRVELDFMCRRSLIEYLGEEHIIDRTDLIRLVMNADSPDPDNPESLPTLPPERWRQLRRKLEEVTVVDPACGSGAFLVGMMQVVSGLHRLICARLGEPYKDFEVKKRIIGENLFGVDIKDWAARVAELRLWLSLIIHASLEEAQGDPGKPILPNLTFRIQAGDSLVEEIAGRSLSLRGRYGQMGEAVRSQVNRLLDRKRDYYYNRGQAMPPQEVRRLETEAFRAILDDELAQIDRELRRLRVEEQAGFQHELGLVQAGGPVRVGPGQTSPEKARLRQQIERLEQERAPVMAVRSSTDIERGKGPFLWDMEFAEVFQHKGGFDIVMGNPPFVRQEAIAPLNKDSQDFTPQQWREEKRRYKEALQRSVQTHWGAQVRVGGRADYYIYFYLHGLALLRPGGTFCFITSNSWLDVGYGADLQSFLLTNMDIKAIYDNHAKRSFGADVNTIIALFRRPTPGADLSGHTARFVAFKRPFEAALTADNLTLIEWADSIQRTEDFRVYPLSQGELWQAGLEQDEEAMALGFGLGKYAGDKWGGKYLRAPDIFFTILEKGKGKLVRLGDIADIHPGCYSGVNDFFYLSGVEAQRVGIEAEFLRLIVRTPEEVRGAVIDPATLNSRVLACSWAKAELRRERKYGVMKYVEWGEKQVTRQRQKTAAGIPWPETETVKRRKPGWWAIPESNLRPACIFMPYVINDRFLCAFSPLPIVSDRCFHRVFANASKAQSIAASLNSSLTPFFGSLLGRANLGQGAMKFETADARRLLMLSPVVLTSAQKRGLFDSFAGLAKREIKNIFEELGLPKPDRDYSNIRPEEVRLDKVLPDRRALDRVVFEALGLTEAEQLEVYRAVAGLVKDRLSKARSG